jgi:hypothetical protein
VLVIVAIVSGGTGAPAVEVGVRAYAEVAGAAVQVVDTGLLLAAVSAGVTDRLVLGHDGEADGSVITQPIGLRATSHAAELTGDRADTECFGDAIRRAGADVPDRGEVVAQIAVAHVDSSVPAACVRRPAEIVVAPRAGNENEYDDREYEVHGD